MICEAEAIPFTEPPRSEIVKKALEKSGLFTGRTTLKIKLVKRKKKK